MKYGLGGNFDFGSAIGESAAKKRLLKSSNTAPGANKIQAAASLFNQASGGQGGGAVSGAASGAAAGASFGPKGALIGGAIGGITGALGARAKRKQQNADIDKEKFMKLADIENQTQLRRSAAIQSLAQNIGNTLLR